MTRNFRDGDTGCPMFGLDDQGRPGLDEKSDDCGACEEQDEELFQACKAECGKATADYGEAPAGEQAAPPNETTAAEEKETDVSAKKNIKKAEKSPKAPKPAKAPKIKKHTLVDAVMGEVLKSKTGGKFNRDTIVDSSAADFPDRTRSAVACQVTFAAVYGIRFGLLK